MEDELVRLRRERLDADRRYNDALTALDRAVTQLLRRRDQLSAGELGALGTALMVFLQQITPFVETKDRELEATAAAGLAPHTRALEALAELRTQVGVLHRSFQKTRREQLSEERPAQSAADVSGTSPSPPGVRSKAGSSGDILYLAFEDRFRGSPEDITAKLRDYVPLFAGASDVLDVGSGRGELLALFREHGISARGVDVNPEMVASARDQGLDVAEGDALAYLESLPDGSLGGLIAVQVVEHLEPRAVIRLIEAGFDKLRPGSPIAIETINPACWLAFFSSYIRDFTHVRPVHPDTLQYLLQASGFERVSIEYKAPVPDQVKMKSIDVPPTLGQALQFAGRSKPGDGSSLASGIAEPEETAALLLNAVGRIIHVVNANAAVLNRLLFTHLDYAAIGHKRAGWAG